MEVIQKNIEHIGESITLPGRATWRQLLPGHRMMTTTKTPLLVAFGVYLSGGRFDLRGFALTSVIAAALWAVLYALNESYDVTAESGIVVSRSKRMILYGAWLVIVAASLLESSHLLMLCLLMSAGQLAYCIPPVRLKRYWWAAPALSGVVNPLLRLECGGSLGTHAIPMLALVTIAAIHLSCSIRTRGLLRKRDEGFGYKVVPTAVEMFGAVSMVGAMVGSLAMCWLRIVPRTFFFITIVVSIVAAYAWSGKVNNISQMRKGWLWFAIGTAFAVAALYYGR